MSEGSGIDQLNKMIGFLKADIEFDEMMLKEHVKWRLSWYQRFKIRQQVRKTRSQIRHYEEIIERYRSEGWTD